MKSLGKYRMLVGNAVLVRVLKHLYAILLWTGIARLWQVRVRFDYEDASAFIDGNPDGRDKIRFTGNQR